MIDTASSTFTEFPLFGTHPSSSSSSSPSCSMEAIVIQRPLYTESYSWSDFPMVVQEDETSSSSCFNNNSNNYIYSNNYNCHSDYEFGRMRRDDSFSSSSSSLYSTSSLSSLDSSLSTASLSSQACSSPASHKASQQQQQPSRRNVRFAPSMGVRTYSLVLGDHPLCGDGLAIEHGWDYNEEQKERSDPICRASSCCWTLPGAPKKNSTNEPNNCERNETDITPNGCSFERKIINA